MTVVFFAFLDSAAAKFKCPENSSASNFRHLAYHVKAHPDTLCPCIVLQFHQSRCSDVGMEAGVEKVKLMLQ